MMPALAAPVRPSRPLEVPTWGVRVRVEKRHGDPLPGESIDDFLARVEAYEVRESEGNLLLNAGIDILLNLLIGAGGTVFSNANAYLGVGDSSTAASASQTDLQASTNKLRVAMDSTYPSLASHVMSFRSSFTSGQANFAWNEWIIANAASGATVLNRKVESLGTKATGTWTLTVTLTPS